MKTIGPVLLVLIAGILSPIIAQFEAPFPRSDCNRNGGPEAYDNMRISIEDIGNNTVKPIMGEILRAYYDSGNEIAAALTMYCGKLEDLHNATISYLEALKPCMKPDEREIPNISNITASVLQFPCAKRHLVEAIHNSTDRQCFSSKLLSTPTCVIEVINSRGSTTNSTNPTQYERECSNVQTYQQCTVRLLGECEDKIFSTTLDSLYKYINNDVPCENLPKLPK